MNIKQAVQERERNDIIDQMFHSKEKEKKKEMQKWDC